MYTTELDGHDRAGRGGRWAEGLRCVVVSMQKLETQFFFQIHQRIIFMCLVFILGIRVYCYIDFLI